MQLFCRQVEDSLWNGNGAEFIFHPLKKRTCSKVKLSPTCCECLVDLMAHLPHFQPLKWKLKLRFNVWRRGSWRFDVETRHQVCKWATSLCVGNTKQDQKLDRHPFFCVTDQHTHTNIPISPQLHNFESAAKQPWYMKIWTKSCVSLLCAF